jgi:hypothetical protein
MMTCPSGSLEIVENNARRPIQESAARVVGPCNLRSATAVCTAAMMPVFSGFVFDECHEILRNSSDVTQSRRENRLKEPISSENYIETLKFER